MIDKYTSAKIISSGNIAWTVKCLKNKRLSSVEKIAIAEHGTTKQRLYLIKNYRLHAAAKLLIANHGIDRELLCLMRHHKLSQRVLWYVYYTGNERTRKKALKKGALQSWYWF